MRCGVARHAPAEAARRVPGREGEQSKHHHHRHEHGRHLVRKPLDGRLREQSEVKTYNSELRPQGLDNTCPCRVLDAARVTLTLTTSADSDVFST
eukprot:5974949-Pyramimonas_sp.AAC.1